MRFSLFRKKRPRNEAVIDLGMINAIEERQKTKQVEQSTQPIKPSEIKFSPGYNYPSETPATNSQATNGANDMGFLANLASAASQEKQETADSGYSSSGSADLDKLE